jgi:hypothetical protein
VADDKRGLPGLLWNGQLDEALKLPLIIKDVMLQSSVHLGFKVIALWKGIQKNRYELGIDLA